MDKHCEFVKDGKRCRAYKITNSNYCFTHSDDPDIVAMREEALKKAADTHRLYLPVECKDNAGSIELPRFINLDKAKGIKKAYITIIKAAAQGGIDEKKLGALVYALNGYVNAIEKIDLLERIERLEKSVEEEGKIIDVKGYSE